MRSVYIEPVYYKYLIIVFFKGPVYLQTSEEHSSLSWLRPQYGLVIIFLGWVHPLVD